MQIFEVFSDQFLLAILFGCFVQVTTIFVLLRVALGLNQIDLALVTLIISLVISTAFIEHKFNAEGINSKNANFQSQMLVFMQEQSDPQIVARLPAAFVSSQNDLNQQQDTVVGSASSQKFFSVQAVYLLSQLKRAFSIGLLLMLPLLLVDFLVAVALSLAGIENLSVKTVAIPLKLILLASVEAWDSIFSKLLVGFI